MRYFYLALFLLCSFTPLKAQHPYPSDVTAYFMSDVQFYDFDRQNYLLGGELRFFVSEVTSLDYNLMLGGSLNEGFVLNSGLGQMASLWLLSRSNFEGFDFWHLASILAVIVPEGLSFYWQMDEKIGLSPYLHPLGADFYSNSLTPEPVRVVSEIGLRLQYVGPRGMQLMPRLGYRHYWKAGFGGLSIGLGFAF